MWSYCCPCTVRSGVTPGKSTWHHHLGHGGEGEGYESVSDVSWLPQYHQQHPTTSWPTGLCSATQVQHVSIAPGLGIKQEALYRYLHHVEIISSQWESWTNEVSCGPLLHYPRPLHLRWLPDSSSARISRCRSSWWDATTLAALLWQVRSTPVLSSAAA